VTSTSSPGRATSILSPIIIEYIILPNKMTSVCLGTLPGGILPGVS
jgi:hypothetical protein